MAESQEEPLANSSCEALTLATGLNRGGTQDDSTGNAKKSECEILSGPPGPGPSRQMNNSLIFFWFDPLKV